MSRMRIVRHVAVAVPLVLHAADITPDFIVVHLLFHPVTDAAVRRQAEAQPQMLGNRQLKRNVVEIDRIITCIERLPVIFLGIVKALPFKTEIAALLAFIVITCIVNSINCIWVAVAGQFVPDFVYNIGTTVLNGGISMVIFFFVNKIIFPEGEKAAK